MPPRKRKLPENEKYEDTDEEEKSTTPQKTKKTFSIFEKPKTTKSSDKKLGGEWLEHGEPVKNLRPLFYYYEKGLPGSQKVAAFDIDFTIIKTKTGKKFPKGRT